MYNSSNRVIAGNRQLRAYAVQEPMSRDEFMDSRSFLGTFIETERGNIDPYALAAFCNSRFNPELFSDRFWESGCDLGWACGYLARFGCIAVPYYGSHGYGGYSSLGLLVAGRREIEAEYGKAKDGSAKARKVLEMEAQEYRDWAEGETYGYIITDDGAPETGYSTDVEFVYEADEAKGDETDSCWGYIGRADVESAARNALINARREKEARIRRESETPLVQRRFTVVRKDSDGRGYGFTDDELMAMRVGETLTDGDWSITRSASRKNRRARRR